MLISILAKTNMFWGLHNLPIRLSVPLALIPASSQRVNPTSVPFQRYKCIIVDICRDCSFTRSRGKLKKQQKRCYNIHFSSKWRKFLIWWHQHNCVFIATQTTTYWTIFCILNSLVPYRYVWLL